MIPYDISPDIVKYHNDRKKDGESTNAKREQN